MKFGKQLFIIYLDPLHCDFFATLGRKECGSLTSVENLIPMPFFKLVKSLLSAGVAIYSG